LIIGTCQFNLRIEWAGSLKEKRAVVKSILGKVQNKFNVSIAEIGDLDAHRDALIGFACVTNETRHAQSTLLNVLKFIEANTEAVVEDVETEIL